MRSLRRAWAFLVVALVALIAPVRAYAEPVNARAFESRLYAPCCYGGTLDTHESELAHDLRGEIESRLARGESTARIQADFVERYGDRVLAARSEKPFEHVALAIGALMVLVAGGIAWVLRRWVRGTSVPGALAPAGGPRDALDDRIDAELEELDG